MSWIDFFTLRIPHIYFIYGLAFFTLGLAVGLEVWRSEPVPFRQVMWPLALFGIIHGTHEWVEMFVIVGKQAFGFQASVPFEIFRLVLLAISFTALIIFGVQRWYHAKQLPYISLSILLLYSVGVILVGWWLNWQKPDWFAAADVLARYSLSIPGAVLAAWAFLSQRQKFLSLNQPAFASDLRWAALALFLYGIVGQFFVGPSQLFPSNFLNGITFQSWFGFPIQLFRATMAVIIALFTIRVLRAFEYYRQRSLAQARRQVEEEIAQRDVMRQEFLRRIVDAQEQERSRIARELHDELGQMLTGLAIGLRGVQTSVEKPRLLRQQLRQLEDMAAQALGNMRHLVNELRPALLDDMGLPAALRHHTKNFQTFTGVFTALKVGKNHHRLPENVETILFRIIQEALTNIARHAHAKHAWVDLHCDDYTAVLEVKDDGRGFDPQPVLDGSSDMGVGLLGIQERVNLVAGTLHIESGLDHGTTLTVRIPLQKGREK